MNHSRWPVWVAVAALLVWLALPIPAAAAAPAAADLLILSFTVDAPVGPTALVVVVANDGPSDATDVTLTVSGYASVVAAQLDSACSWDDLSIVCGFPTMPCPCATDHGASAIAVMDESLPLPAEGLHSPMLATVSSSLLDPDEANNSRGFDAPLAGTQPLAVGGASAQQTAVSADAVSPAGNPSTGDTFAWILFAALALTGGVSVLVWRRRVRALR